MSATSDDRRCDQAQLLYLYAARALPKDDVPAMEAHIAECRECRRALDALRAVIDSFMNWGTDILSPSPSLWGRLLDRIATDEETKDEETKRVPSARSLWSDPPWEDVAPGISCKLLAKDSPRDRVSMLVRLAPGVAYPPHRHSGVEELHLLQGELWIEDRKLYPGDYNRAEPGTADRRVWSETGCTCVLITSPSDVLG
jgi:anti-sigma factor ChrR (cupin superfamily)